MASVLSASIAVASSIASSIASAASAVGSGIASAASSVAGMTTSQMATTGAILGGIGTVAGGTVGAIGAIQQHQQAKINAKMQADQLQYNKRLEEREAAFLEAESAENARRQRLAAQNLRASQIALLGKSGAAMSSGSPLAVLGQTAADAEKSIQDYHYSSYRQSVQLREQAKMYGYQARVARAQAPSSSSLGLNLTGQAFNTIGTLGTIAGNYAIGSASIKNSGMADKPLF